MQKTLPVIRRNIIFLSLIFTGFVTHAQNISNPDFESLSTCPTQQVNISYTLKATNWTRPTGGTSDYFNDSCSFNISSHISAYSGKGFVGAYMETRNGALINYKEYLTNHLSTPLVAGVTYTFSFHIAHLYGASPTNMAPALNYVDLPGTEQGFIGAVFSTVAPTTANAESAAGGGGPIVSTFGSGRVLIPDTNTAVYGQASRNAWVPVTLKYTAVGGEQYLTFGQFRSGATTMVNGNATYYLFDNFSSALVAVPDEVPVSGTIFNDVNGNTLIDNGEQATGLPAPLYVYLVSGDGTIADSAQVANNGTYTLNAAVSQNYTVILSAVQYAPDTNTNTTPINTNLPAGWVTTGENAAGNTGNGDGTANGMISISVGTSAIGQMNFGIEQPPVLANDNPTGTVGNPAVINVLSNDTDPNGGSVVATTVTLIAPQGSTCTNTDAEGDCLAVSVPNQGTWTVDAVTGAITFTPNPGYTGNPSPITYSADDNAGKPGIPATITLTYPSTTLNGTVFNDINGNGIMNGAENGNTLPTPLYVYLVDGSGKIIDSSHVSSNGTYSLNGAPATAYTVQVSSNQYTPGTSNPIVAGIPTGWVITGETLNNTTNDGTPNGSLAFTTGAAGSVANNMNFGIEQPPVLANDNPTGTVGNPAVINVLANDTDPNGGTIVATTVTLIAPQGSTCTNTDAEGDCLAVSVPNQGTWTVDAVTGAITFTPNPGYTGSPSPITYSADDNAGKPGIPATITLTYPSTTLNGTVFNDINGNGIMNGAENGNTLPTPLYVYLVDGYGKIIDSSQVSNNGTYSLNGAPATAYTLQISSNQYTPGNSNPIVAGIPTGWVITGETLNNTTNDGTPNGSLAFTTGAAGSVANNMNFGIEQPPVLANDNPTGTVGNPAVINVLSNDTDPNGGTIVATTVTLIAPQGSTCTNTDAEGDCLAVSVPNQGTWTVDAVTGAITFTPNPGYTGSPSPITYSADDNAGKPGTPATITLTYPSTTLNGTVFNDINGNGIMNGAENGNTLPTPLYVYLVDGSGKIIDSSQVNSNGTYSLNGAPATAYTVQISSNQYTPGNSNPIVAGIPTGWVITGETVNNITDDGYANGIVAVTTGATGSVGNNINFGIEQPPVANNATAPGQPNPGGNVSVTVPPATFVTSDPAPGGVTHIVISTLPTNANSITINGTTYNASNPLPPGGVNVPVNTNGQPTQPILVDPVNGPVTVGIEYYAVDGAGKQSATATASVPFTTFAISGNVYHDNNGLAGTPANTIDGTGTNVGGLKAVLVNTTNNTVAAVVNVAANGSFSFPEVNAGNYSVLITTANVSGNQAPPVVLPAGWITAGEFQGTGAGNDGNANGILALGAASSAINNVKFGIQQLPEAYDIPQNFQLNPGGTATVPVATLGGNDPEDGTLGAGGSLVIVTLPAQGTLYYNGVPVNAGDTIHNYVPASLQVDPIDGVANVVFQYTVVDNAGFADPTPATVNMSFIPIPLNGNVFNDANGMNNNIVNGTGIGTASGMPLYVNLVDTATNTVIASVPVNANGSYSFSTVRPDAHLSVQVNTVQGIAGQPAPAVQLPNGWLPTGENTGTGAGHDGTPDGKQIVYTGLAYSGVSNVNFGIERTPTADPKTVNTPSVGLNVPYPLTAVPLSGTDPEDGTFGAGSSNFVFGQQPTCCAVISYNGTPLVPGATIPNYNPALLTVTFTDITAQQAIFTYKVVDAAGKQSPEVNYIINTGTVLPVKWSVFTAKAEQISSRLDWTTLAETNNVGFGIERSADGRSFKEISFVSTMAENGNSKEALDYTTYDNAPLSGTNYYRLKQTDKDGQYTYSEVREVVFGASGNTISIYPNPATDKVFVKAADWTKIKEVNMLDATGRQVYQSLAADATAGIPMDSRAQGTYLIQVVHNNGEVTSFKLVKK